MPNPYASTAGAATITAAVAGNESLNEMKGPSGPDRDPASGARMSAAQVTRRLLAYVRPHRMTLVVQTFLSFLREKRRCWSWWPCVCCAP